MESYKLFWTVNAVLALGILTFACTKEVEVQKSYSPEIIEEKADGKFPYRQLSTYGFFTGKLNQLNPTSELILYEPASSLFTDYALKSRFILFPENQKASITNDEFNFPVGTTLIKNFYYPDDFRKPDGNRRIIETRLLINEGNGWVAYPYMWNDEQTEAFLKVVGGEVEVKFTNLEGEDQVINYLVPNKNQCKSCHNASEELVPIGVKVKHLNNELEFESGKENQLAHWVTLGKLVGFKGPDAHPSIGNYEDKSLSLDTRARAYLDINCANCHIAEGPASTSGLFLNIEETDPMRLGFNKPPVAAGKGAGSFKYDIVPGKADQSILIHRMNSVEVGVAMPELGRSTVHKEGVELIRKWINTIQETP